MMGKRAVKVEEATSKIDDMSVIPWKEAWNGYYDEALETHIDSKQQYRELMKEKGFVPYSKERYSCKSNAQRTREGLEAAKVTREKAFKQALEQHCTLKISE